MEATAQKIEVGEVLGGLCASAVLVDVNVSQWVGRKKDASSTRKIIADNNAQSADAANVTKKLLVGNPKLEAIGAFVGRVRNLIGEKTLPWMGDLKLLPMQNFLEFQQLMRECQANFDWLVDDFLADYDLQVSAQAFKLGTLFNRQDYPSASELRRKFALRYTIAPLPTSGDFRVEAEQDLRAELQAAYQKAAQEQLDVALRGVWERLEKCLLHIQERLTDDGEKPKIFRDSMLDNAVELVKVLETLNVTNDPHLEAARRDLERMVHGLEADDLRKDASTREQTKQAVATILSKYDF